MARPKKPAAAAQPTRTAPAAQATQLETLVHPADIARRNIPTAETAALMAEEDGSHHPLGWRRGVR
jgi:adenine-specific DNA-methyltransferase